MIPRMPESPKSTKMRKEMDIMLKKISVMTNPGSADMGAIKGGGVDSKPIGEMTPQEIVEEYKKAPEGSISQQFIIMYVEMSNLKDECPEIFL